MATDYCITLTTIDSYERARQLARTLVSEQLAACCTILPGATSVYTWNNTVHEDTEFLLLIKTSHALFASLQQRISELHPYEVPEIIAVDIGDISAPYAKWMRSVLQP